MKRIKLAGFLAVTIAAASMLVACNGKLGEYIEQSKAVKEAKENEANVENVGDETTGTTEEGNYDEGTLEEYFNNPLNAYLIENLKSSLGNGYENVYKDVKITFKKNRMTYEFYFTEDHGNIQESIEPTMKNAAPKLFEELRTYFNPKDKLEIEMVYFNPDGSTSADVVCVEGDDVDEAMFDSEADPGTVQYYYETHFGTDYWDNSVASAKEMSKEIYSDIQIEIVGNSLKYKYYLVANVGDVQDILAEDFTDEYMQSAVEQLKAPAEVEGMVFLEYIFYNPDGSVAAQFTAQG